MLGNGYGTKDGLRGFTSLRTSQLRPVDQDLIPPKRRCIKCGAVLRRSNPGPTCARVEYSGLEATELTDLERILVETGPHGVDIVVKMRTGESQLRPGGHDDRNEAVRQMAAEGMSRSSIAEVIGVSKGTVNDIIWRRYQQ
jgi:hypothetical protein